MITINKKSPHKYLTYKDLSWVADGTRTHDIQNHKLENKLL